MSNILNESYTISNEVTIPKIGFGTWQISNDDVRQAVLDALSVGYRHIDTAALYKNENGVGTAIKNSNIPRNEIFLTTKINADVKDYKSAVSVIEQSFENLQTDYIDLFLIHSPRPWSELFERGTNNYFAENLEVWRALTEYYKAGKIRAIGVSNFDVDDIQNIIDNSDVKPFVNQICVHIGHTPQNIIDFCQSNDILVEAYSPNATGKLRGNDTVNEIAKKYNVSVPQLGIRYDIQLGTVPLPKTTHKEFMIQNADVDFTISDEDMEKLKQITGINHLA